MKDVWHFAIDLEDFWFWAHPRHGVHVQTMSISWPGPGGDVLEAHDGAGVIAIDDMDFMRLRSIHDDSEEQTSLLGDTADTEDERQMDQEG
jgi:hypothetical protein